MWSTQDPVLRFSRTCGELANRRRVDELVLKRQAARWLAGAALVELHAGRPASALECLETVLGITQMQRDEYSLVTQMHRIARGGHPVSLDQLVPEYLRAVPIDPLTGEPMLYWLHSDGTFNLYSVGRDGVDDGGDPTLTTSNKLIVLRGGRDAVWPSAGR